MLALGDGDFIAQGEDSALSVSETHRTTFSGGAGLPYGFVVAFLLAGGRRTPVAVPTGICLETFQQEWPIGQVRWTRTSKERSAS
jgi:hypothetical protein